MKIEAVIRGNHHEGIPTFSIDAEMWGEAERQFKQGIQNIIKKNDEYDKKYKGYYALRCPIIDFKTDEYMGHCGFDLNTSKSLESLIQWYIDSGYSNNSAWFKTA